MSTQEGCPNATQWARDTLLCKYRAAVRKEIERHKWFESEKAGYDIGWDRAAVDWMIRFGPHFIGSQSTCE